jgi:hypothetical protein
MSNIDKKINTPLNPEERLKLNDLIRNVDDYKDNTQHIRNVKHSKQLITSIGIIEQLKIHYADIKKNNMDEFKELCASKCSFFYTNYTDIFNKLINDEFDLQILSQFLQVLRAIEDAQIDQQEGSVIIGRLLKELYIDSALKHSAKLDLLNDKNDENPREKPEINNRGVSWNEYKKNINYLTAPLSRTK